MSPDSTLIGWNKDFFQESRPQSIWNNFKHPAIWQNIWKRHSREEETDGLMWPVLDLTGCRSQLEGFWNIPAVMIEVVSMCSCAFWCFWFTTKPNNRVRKDSKRLKVPWRKILVFIKRANTWVRSETWVRCLSWSSSDSSSDSYLCIVLSEPGQ